MVELHFVELAVGVGFLKEFGVGAGVDDLAAGHDDDHVGRKHGGEAVGDGDHGFAGGEFFQGGLDHALALGIEGRGGFVEQEHGGVLQQGAGDGEALLLSAGKFAAFVADDGFVALRLGENEIVGVGLAGGFFDLFACGVGASEKDVVVDGVVEKKGVLRDDADMPAQGIERDAAEIASVEAHGTAVRIVEAQNQREHGALAGSARADEGDALSGFDLQRDIVQCRHIVPVREADAVEFDRALA